jgi:hypothetical protein
MVPRRHRQHWEQGASLQSLDALAHEEARRALRLPRRLWILWDRSAWCKSMPRLSAALLLVLSFPAAAISQGQSSATQSSPAVPGAAQPSVQSPSQAPLSATGWLGFEQFQYGVNNLGTVFIEDTDLGYGFTDHLSGDIGVPVIFTRNPFSPVVDHDYYWSALIGEPYLDVKYSGVYHDVNYTSVLTGTIPVRSEDRTYTTGRFGVDWFNHLDEQIGPIVPFLNLEASNGSVNRFVMPRPFEEARPYQTLGFMGEGEAGFETTVKNRFVKGLNIGGSAYIVAPAGPQKVFSRLVFPYSSLAGDGHHGRYFDSSFETTGISSIARDNGFSAWLDTHWHTLDVELGYTRSIHYDLDMYTVMLNLDARSAVRNLMHRR